MAPEVTADKKATKEIPRHEGKQRDQALRRDFPRVFANLDIALAPYSQQLAHRAGKQLAVLHSLLCTSVPRLLVTPRVTLQPPEKQGRAEFYGAIPLSELELQERQVCELSLHFLLI